MLIYTLLKAPLLISLIVIISNKKRGPFIYLKLDFEFHLSCYVGFIDVYKLSRLAIDSFACMLVLNTLYLGS